MEKRKRSSLALLLRAATTNRKHISLLIATVVAMCTLTVASQLEIFSLRVITDKGVDFFSLFGNSPEGISKAEILDNWEAVADTSSGLITKDSASDYLISRPSGNQLSQFVAYLDSMLGFRGNLMNLAILMVAIALFKGISLFIQRYTSKLVAIQVSSTLRRNYFEHIQTLPLSFYQEYNVGSLSTRVVADSRLVAEAVTSALVNYLETPFKFLSTLVLCMATSPQLTVVVFLGIPVLIFPIVFMARRIKRAVKRIQISQENFASVLIDFLTGIQTVKAFAMEEFSRKKYFEQNEHMAHCEKRASKYENASRPLIHTLSTFLLATSLIYGLYVTSMEVPDILFFCGILWVLYEPVKKFAEENMNIQKGVAAAERMFDIMDLKPSIQDKDGAVEFKGLQDAIVFENVYFAYDHHWILKDVSFTVKKGETVAIVGPTGAGKSTIVQLLPRLYDVNKGRICLDGIPVTEFTQKSLREEIAFIPQRPFLFLDTISENIAFGRNFSKEDVIAASKAAHAHEFIVDLPNQYDTELIQSGSNLSGGQGQRVAIARALVKKGSVLIMDEATSALDAVSESKIRQTISELKGHVTQIIIAHRLSILEHVDKVIYIHKGEKLGEGTKEELLKTCPEFKRMWDSHFAQVLVES